MGRLPVLSGRDAVKAFSRDGWRVVRTHGSHVMMAKDGREEVLAIPQHPELRKGVLRSLLRAAGLRVEEFPGPVVTVTGPPGAGWRRAGRGSR